MKRYLVFAIVLFGQIGVAQVVTNASLSKEYEVAKTRFPSEYRTKIEEMEKDVQVTNPSMGGLVLCVPVIVDTLNKSEINPARYSYEHHGEDMDSLDILFCSAQIEGDFLKINMGAPFGNQFIDFKIKGNNVNASWA